MIYRQSLTTPEIVEKGIKWLCLKRRFIEHTEATNFMTLRLRKTADH